jgi:putative membrane protein
MGFYDMMSGWGGGFFGWSMYLGMIAFWVAVVVLVVWLVKAVGSSGPSQPAAAGPAQPESPLDTLKRRYAAGEIDSSEYQRRKADIV